MGNLVSIIVPVYNAEQTLNRCVQSILAQTYPYMEIILVNDGSTDKSAQLCDSLSQCDIRIKVLHKPNGGASSARNYGLEYAKGEYISFIDADDWIDKDYLEQLLPNEGEEMVVCSISYEGDTNRNLCISDKIRNRKCIEGTLHQMLDHMTICSPCCKIMRRDIIEQNDIRFDVNVSAGEDMLFICDYFSAGLDKIRTISQPLYHYYVADSGSLSHRIVDFATTEYILDCIKERIDKLSKVYNWDSDDGYKRHLCTQFNNMIAYAKSSSSFFERLKYMKRIVDNSHIRVLLSDVDYMVKRKRLNGIKAMAYRISMQPLKLYYYFK